MKRFNPLGGFPICQKTSVRCQGHHPEMLTLAGEASKELKNIQVTNWVWLKHAGDSCAILEFCAPLLKKSNAYVLEKRVG